VLYQQITSSSDEAMNVTFRFAEETETGAEDGRQLPARPERVEGQEHGSRSQ